MGADIKSLRVRIKSVDSTLHLTKAMELVASSKMRRANEAMIRSREYYKAAQNCISMLAGRRECASSPYVSVKGGAETPVRLIIIAGDRGLAGGYNANIFRIAKDYPEAEIIPIGKRACDRFGKAFCSSEYFTSEEAYSLAKTLCEDFTAGKYAKLGILSTKYLSVISQEARVKWLLPLSADEMTDADSDTKADRKAGGVIFEPDEMSMLNAAVPIYISAVLTACVRESFACEVAARRTAMNSAGRNAKEMIDSLQLEYNRARQGAITQEITEIVAGSGL